MRWRIAAALAVLGIAGTPAVADAMQAHAASTVHVTVRPGTGSPGSHFGVSFRAAVATGQHGSLVRSYRVTAGLAKRTGCRSSATDTAPTAAQGAMVRVTLSPGHTAWCTGTFKGQVWLYQTVVCGPPMDAVCPQVEIRPAVVGTFTFRVTRG